MASVSPNSSNSNNQQQRVLSQSRRSSNHEIVTFLENSPKGKIVYQTGWDDSPNSIWQLVKTVQANSEEKKHDVLERAYRAAKVAERRSLSSLSTESCSPDQIDNKSGFSKNKSFTAVEDNLLSPFGVGGLSPSPSSNISYGIGSSSSQSLVATPTRGSSQRLMPHNISNQNTKAMVKVASNSNSDKITKRLSYRSLGIREEEDDLLNLDDEDMEPIRSSYYEVKKMIIDHENEKIRQNVEKKKREMLAFDEATERRAIEYAKTMAKLRIEKELQDRMKMQELERDLNERRNKELARRKMFQEKDDYQFENQRQEELMKLSAALKHEKDIQKRLEEQQKEERLIKERELEENLKKEKQLRDESERLANEKAQVEKDNKAKAVALSQQVTTSGQDLPPGLKNYILKEDLLMYTKLISIEEKITNDVAHISSSDNSLKEYYFGALKVINTPLNSLANLSEAHLQQKVIHFIDLLSGKPVIANETMHVPFQATSVRMGNLFIMKVLAYRFIKKSETEITKQKSCVESLATVGIHLCKRFPEWATLVNAYFYKMCPFLVPFSFPRNDDTVEEYAKRLGHDLSGGESAMLQTLLDKITGYCTLYALMVKQFELRRVGDIGLSTKFFSIGEVWRILSATMRLEPQLDVTATTIHILLDILGDRLQAIYGKQFKKLILHLVTVYLPKLRSVTPAGKAGALTRLQIFIKQKWFM